MNLLKFILTALLLIVISMTAVAQRPEGGRQGFDPTERANQQTERMVKSLDLSTAQGEKIKALNLAFAEKTKTARMEARAAGGDRTAMRERMKTLRDEHQTNLKKYLTTEQIEKWEKLQAERPRREGTRDGRRNRKDKDKSEKENG